MLIGSASGFILYGLGGRVVREGEQGEVAGKEGQGGEEGRE